MRRLFHLLLLAAVLWSGLHPAEPALAREDSINHQLEAGFAFAPDFANPDGDADGDSSDAAAHPGHHHCPPGTCDHPPVMLTQFAFGRPLLFARQSPILESLAQAPPLQPPAA